MSKRQTHPNKYDLETQKIESYGFARTTIPRAAFPPNRTKECQEKLAPLLKTKDIPRVEEENGQKEEVTTQTLTSSSLLKFHEELEQSYPVELIEHRFATIVNVTVTKQMEEDQKNNRVPIIFPDRTSYELHKSKMTNAPVELVPYVQNELNLKDKPESYIRTFFENANQYYDAKKIDPTSLEGLHAMFELNLRTIGNVYNNYMQMYSMGYIKSIVSSQKEMIADVKILADDFMHILPRNIDVITPENCKTFYYATKISINIINIYMSLALLGWRDAFLNKFDSSMKPSDQLMDAYKCAAKGLRVAKELKKILLFVQTSKPIIENLNIESYVQFSLQTIDHLSSILLDSLLENGLLCTGNFVDTEPKAWKCYKRAVRSIDMMRPSNGYRLELEAYYEALSENDIKGSIFSAIISIRCSEIYNTLMTPNAPISEKLGFIIQSKFHIENILSFYDKTSNEDVKYIIGERVHGILHYFCKHMEKLVPTQHSLVTNHMNTQKMDAISALRYSVKSYQDGLAALKYFEEYLDIYEKFLDTLKFRNPNYNTDIKDLRQKIAITRSFCEESYDKFNKDLITKEAEVRKAKEDEQQQANERRKKRIANKNERRKRKTNGNNKQEEILEIGTLDNVVEEEIFTPPLIATLDSSLEIKEESAELVSDFMKFERAINRKDFTSAHFILAKISNNLNVMYSSNSNSPQLAELDFYNHLCGARYVIESNMHFFMQMHSTSSLNPMIIQQTVYGVLYHSNILFKKCDDALSTFPKEDANYSFALQSRKQVFNRLQELLKFVETKEQEFEKLKQEKYKSKDEVFIDMAKTRLCAKKPDNTIMSNFKKHYFPTSDSEYQHFIKRLKNNNFTEADTTIMLDFGRDCYYNNPNPKYIMRDIFTSCQVLNSSKKDLKKFINQHSFEVNGFKETEFPLLPKNGTPPNGLVQAPKYNGKDEKKEL